jgi:two-component system, LytTR family, sensor kinase
MTQALQRARWRFLAGALFWTGVGVAFALPRIDDASDWRAPLAASLASWWAWGLLTLPIIALDRRLPFAHAQAGARAAAQCVLGLAFGVVHLYLKAVLAVSLGLGAWSGLAAIRLLTRASGENLLWSMLVYALIVGAWWAYGSRQRYAAAEVRIARMERSYTEARLNALRMQLDPHFLFNTLNAISAQVQADPHLARQMIEQLGDLLRLSLDSKSRDEVALVDELAFLDLYLSIQRIRFGERLRIVREIAPEVRHAAVPSLLLQPLVENAIRHGLSRRAGGGTITISARCSDAVLELTVADDGAGLPANGSAAGAPGLGLRLTRERIAGFHPPGTTALRVDDRPGGGVEVALRLPLRLKEPADVRA